MSKAALLLIGSEITTGRIQDTHGKRLSSLLVSRGFEIHSISIVPDAKEIDADIRRLAGAADLLLLTGGLGPTSDDMTREAVAKAAGVPLVFMEDLWKVIQGHFRGVDPAVSNRRQAEIPQGFEAIHNTCGTAPGFAGRIGEAGVVAMPGPPRELEAMIQSFLYGYLDENFKGAPLVQTRGTAFLVPESLLEDSFEEIGRPGEIWRTQAQGHRILFEFSSTERGEDILKLIRQKLGKPVIRSGEVSAAQLLSDLLAKQKRRLVCAESCTGGLIGKMMTDLPGSSEVFWGSLVTYDNEAKQKLLSVKALEKYGAVSRETVIEMTEGAIAVSDADAAVAVSGIAGPEGGTEIKPVGTVWIAVQARDRAARAAEFRFHGDRNRVRLRAAVAAMLFLESELQGNSVDIDLLRSYT